MLIKSQYSESELIRLIKENDKAAFCHLYDSYGGVLLFIIRKLITDVHTSEDILHDVFVNIWMKIDQFDPQKSSLYTWMSHIARNKSIDFVRSNAHNMSSKTVGNEEIIERLHLTTEQKTDKIGLNQMIAKLPKDHRSLICLVYYKGHTLSEVSRNLCIPLGTVKTRMRNALSSLRKEFSYAL